MNTDEIIEVNDGTAKFRIWWTPQVPMEPFYAEVPTYAEARRLENTLGLYDAFQFENRVKGDYCNAGGVQFCHATVTGGEWEDVEDFLAEEYGWEPAAEAA